MPKKLHIIVAIITTLALVLSACASPSSSSTQSNGTSQPGTVPQTGGAVQINGAGATFPQPVYSEWILAYKNVDPSVTINYQGIGSGGGKKDIIDRTVDFAGSDSLLTQDEYSKGKDLQMFPALAGAVVLIYNIPGLAAGDPGLILDRQTLVGIYNATIKKWNDPAIAALNPKIASKLPDQPITVAHRSDGSGTTEMFTKALSAFSPDWKAGGAASVQWPVDQAGNGVGGKGNPGVTATVQNTPNSIGYVELSYALANKLPFAQMVNKSGKTVTADANSLLSAMNDFANNFTDQLTNTIVDGPGEGSWPIAGYTYIILHMQSMTDCNKAQKLLQYLHWTWTDSSAAKTANELGYAAIPAPVQSKVLAKLGEVTCNGKPVPSK